MVWLGAVLSWGTSAGLGWALLGVYGPPTQVTYLCFTGGCSQCQLCHAPMCCGTCTHSVSLCVLPTAWWVLGHRLPLGLRGQEPGSSSAGSTGLPPS